MTTRLTRGTCRLRQLTVFVAWLMLAGTAFAQNMVTEVLPAGFRSAEELAAILQPLIPPPGSVGGFHNQLVIKTTPENLAELKQVLASLDKATANLLVSVRRTLDAEVSQDLATARLGVRSGSTRARIGAQRNPQTGAEITVRRGALIAGAGIQRRTSSSQDRSTQQVRVLEGKEAFIQSGESIAVPDQQVIINGRRVIVTRGTRQEEFGSGFWAKARLNGDQVTLEIYPQQRRRRNDGGADVQGASTSVSGVLGRWMEIGGVNSQSATRRSTIGSSRSSASHQSSSIYVRVERLD